MLPPYTKIYREVFDESITSHSPCFTWHKSFKGRSSCELEGVTATMEVMINTVVAIMMCDPRLSFKHIANILDIYIGNAYTTLHDHLHISYNGSCIISTHSRMLRNVFLEFVA